MFKVLMRVTPNVWHEKHFTTESEARKAANNAFKSGAYQVELYKKDSRCGYIPLKKARQTMRQAAQRCGEHLAEGFEP